MPHDPLTPEQRRTLAIVQAFCKREAQSKQKPLASTTGQADNGLDIWGQQPELTPWGIDDDESM